MTVPVMLQHAWVYRGRYEWQRVFECDRCGTETLLPLHGPGADFESTLWAQPCSAMMPIQMTDSS